MSEPFICLGGCGRRLTAQESLARGYGPDCWEKLHGPTPSRPHIPSPAHTDIHPGQTALDLTYLEVTLWSL